MENGIWQTAHRYLVPSLFCLASVWYRKITCNGRWYWVSSTLGKSVSLSFSLCCCFFLRLIMPAITLLWMSYLYIIKLLFVQIFWYNWVNYSSNIHFCDFLLFKCFLLLLFFLLSLCLTIVNIHWYFFCWHYVDWSRHNEYSLGYWVCLLT